MDGFDGMKTELKTKNILESNDLSRITSETKNKENKEAYPCWPKIIITSRSDSL